MKQFLYGCLCLVAGSVMADTNISFSDGNFMKIKDGVVAMGDAQGEVHFRTGSDVITVVDRRDKSYMPIEKEAIQQTMNSVMAELEAQLAQVPEAQREMMREMMKKRMPGMQEKPTQQVDLRRTGEKGEAAGFNCDVNEMSIDGELQYKICVIAPSKAGIPDADAEAMFEAMDTMRNLAESMPGAPRNSLSEIDLRRMGGVPVIFTDLKSNEVNTVSAISTDPLEPIVIPSDYKKRNMQDMMR